MQQEQRKNSVFRRFSKEETGSFAIEFVVMLPLLIFAWLFVVDAFYGFRINTVNQKAAYTLSDMISRETTPINSAYLDGSLELFTFLTDTRVRDRGIRFTAVKFDADSNDFELEWSQSRGSLSPASDGEVAGWVSRLPTMPDNEIIMVVETYQHFIPTFDIGFNERDIHNFVFVRPRYAPQVLYSDGA